MTKAEAGPLPGTCRATPRPPRAPAPAIPPFLRDGLEELVAGHDGGEPLFTSPRGERLLYAQWSKRVFRPAMAAAGIDPDGRTLTLYSLRHTFASVAIAAGADVKTLQELMGHEDATVTLNTYAAAFADRRVEVAGAGVRRVRRRARPDTHGRAFLNNFPPGVSQSIRWFSMLPRCYPARHP